MQKYYVDTRPGFDATAAALGGRTDAAGQSHSMVEESALLSIEKLSIDRAMRTRGASLNILTERMIALDDGFPTTASEKEFQNYKRHGRRAVFKSLTEEEHDAQKTNATVEQFNARVSILTRF